MEFLCWTLAERRRHRVNQTDTSRTARRLTNEKLQWQIEAPQVVLTGQKLDRGASQQNSWKLPIAQAVES